MKRCCVLLALLVSAPAYAAEPAYEREVRPLLVKYCFDCHHDSDEPEGGVNLERFTTTNQVLRERSAWKLVLEKLESKQMPPPKEAVQPSRAEREQMQAWIAQIAAHDDPQLGARDPGQPVLRRLTRLEYNNTVRDLLALETDVFMFPERLALADKRYFQPASGKLEGPVTVRLREYGAKYPVLLPASGLPGDNRAEHGYRNRGDAMNLSPLALEKYVALAGEIAQHPDLPRRSAVFAELLGLAPQVASKETNDSAAPEVAHDFAAGIKDLRAAADNPHDIATFREQLKAAIAEGRGGVMEIAPSLANSTIEGKGGLLKASFGHGQQLTVNPNADLWLVSFATARPTSPPLLIANKQKGEKQYELTFEVRNGDEDEGITTLGLCVLPRKDQSGKVTLTTTFSDGETQARSIEFRDREQAPSLALFASPPGETIRKLAVDGDAFTGDYVLIDDLAFITDGQPRSATPMDEPPATPLTKEWQDPPRERIARFLKRAFRRPVAEEELQRYLALYEAALAEKRDTAAALRAVAQAALASPHFLFLAEGASNEAHSHAHVRKLTDHELASRLSYFLWQSMPDDELLALADEGKLHDERVLRAQTQRMLRDPKARELSESYAVQWLRLDQLHTAKPDRELFQQFYAGPQGKSTLHGSQLVEALLLFETVLVEDRSILDFVAADYTWLNPAMAKLYGIEQPTSAPAAESVARNMTNRELKGVDKDANNQWRRVALKDSSRGGYLTMSAPLTVTSLPFRTSPVKRGAWLLETVFHRPPTEPKVAFTIENDTKEASTMQSIRAKFEAHRTDAACYSCHIRLDPPGFALERFDAIGAWRETDGGVPVDARGEWNGVAFAGPAEFKRLLRKQPHEFTRGFVEHLLSYALARPLELYDLPAITAIEAQAAQHDYRLQTVLAEVVASYPFRHTRVEAAQAP